MIKIISGKYKGHKLKDVPDKYVRPTQAVVRKSMLQILEPFLGLQVLDLYAGVGTFGIEALSRGASSLTAAEKNRFVFHALQGNLELICKEDNSKVILNDVDRFLRYNTEKFDIIFADPPYGECEYDELFQKVKSLLNPDGIFCMEMKRVKINDPSVRIKKYGSTQVIFWRAAS